MIRSIIWYFKFFFTLFLGYPVLKRIQKLIKDEKIDEYHKYSLEKTSKWAMQRIKDSGAEVSVKGEENIPLDENVLFVSNHQSDFDIAIFMALIPTSKTFVAKVELKKIPLLKTWMECMGCVFIDRKDPKNSLKAILKASKILKSGQNVVIFPEGRRSKSSKMNEFKEGSFILATKNKVPIIPVTIDGSYKLKEMNNGLIKPNKVSVYIHKPIYTDNLTKDETKNLHKYVENIIKNKISG